MTWMLEGTHVTADADRDTAQTLIADAVHPPIPSLTAECITWSLVCGDWCLVKLNKWIA